MAIAPVNKFLSVAVPVHPGEQLLYEVPTGTSAILLYAQVSNVGIGTTYPTISFIHRRESRSTGNKRDIRIIKDVEIPPNDAVILIDGRLILEKSEGAALEAGFKSCELMATLAGESLYLKSGYKVLETIEWESSSNVRIPLKRMSKNLVKK